MMKSSSIVRLGIIVLIILVSRNKQLGHSARLTGPSRWPCSRAVVMKLRGGRAEDSDMAVAPLHPVGIDELDDEFDEAFRRAAGPGKFAQGDTSRGADAQTGQLVRSPEEVIEEAEKYVEQNDLDGAELVYVDYLEANGEDLEVMESYALFLWSMRKDVSSAREVFEGILNKDRRRLDIMTSYAMFLKDGCKDFQGAMKLYEELLQIHPREASLYFSMALMHHGAAGQEHLYTEDERLELEDLKNVTKAVELYRTAIELEPTMVEALNNLATVLLQESINFTESEVLLVRSLKIDPNQTGTLIEYAKLMTKVCNIDRATLLFQRIMNITNSTGQVEEEFFSAYLEFLVRFKAKRNNPTRADVIAHVLASDPTNEIALRISAFDKMHDGDTIEAISAVQKALLLSEKPGLLLLYSDLLLQSGKNHAEAVNAIMRAMQIEPLNERIRERFLELFGDQPELVNMTFARAYEYAMAKGCVIWSKRIDAERTAHLIRFASGEEKEEMQKHLEELAASFAHDFDVVFSCSKGFMQIKEYTLAERWLEHAVQLRPCSSPALAKLAQVILIMRNDVKATYRMLKRSYLSDPFYLPTSISFGLLFELEGKLKLAQKLYG